MEQTSTQPTLQTDFLFLGARFFERVAYYGFRGTVLSFLVNQQLSNDSYGIFNLLFFIYGSIMLHLIGGALGDFVFGSKRATIIGGILFAIGLMLGCIPFTGIIYLSFGLIVLGEGMFTPNFYAFFGKHYLNHQRKIDSRLTAISIAINIGAFTGPIFVGYLIPFFNNTLFFIALALAVSIGLAVYLIHLIPSPIQAEIQEGTKETSSNMFFNKRNTIFLFVLALLNYYCMVFFSDIASSISTMLDNNTYNFFGVYISIAAEPVGLIFSFIIGVVMVFVWNRYYTSSLSKLFISTALLLVAFLALTLLFFFKVHFSLIISIAFGILVGFIEVYRYPFFYSWLIHKINPKYYGVTMGAGKLLITLFTMIIPGFFLAGNDIKEDEFVRIGIIVSILCVIGLFYLIRKSSSLDQNEGITN